MPAEILPNTRLEALDRLGELRDVTEALDGLELLALGETPSREEIAALFRLVREALGARQKAAERALGRP